MVESQDWADGLTEVFAFHTDEIEALGSELAEFYQVRFAQGMLRVFSLQAALAMFAVFLAKASGLEKERLLALIDFVWDKGGTAEPTPDLFTRLPDA